MSDIVERLQSDIDNTGDTLPLQKEAADEITRLRVSNAELLAALERIAEASSERSDGIGSASILSGIARAAVEKAKEQT